MATFGRRIRVDWLVGWVRAPGEILGLWAATTTVTSVDVIFLLGGAVEDPFLFLPVSRVKTQTFWFWRRQRSGIVPFLEALLWDDGALSVLGRQ